MKLKILNFTSFIFFFLVCSLNYASTKILEDFNTTNNFYLSNNSGSVNGSISSNEYYTGNKALKLSYSLNGSAGNYIECFRSYSTNTLDISFKPNYLSIYLKGESNNSDVFKFMLYEDINGNGNPFDAEDEIWVFTNNTILSSINWTELQMPYNNFTKFNGGTGTIDLNRIGAWRVYITNDGKNSNHTIYLDNLSQNTTFEFNKSDASLNGTFLQLWNSAGCQCGQFSNLEWEIQLQHMKDLCINNLVIQYGVYGDYAWYASGNASFVNFHTPTLEKILTEAEKIGINIYIGLYFDESWNTANKDLTTTYTDLLNKHKAVIDDIYNIANKFNSFYGWYIPQEINDLEWKTTTRKNLLSNWLKNVSDYAKSKDNSKKIMIAPFFGPNQPADLYESWWKDVLKSATNIDEVFPQDGVGTTTKDSDTDVPLYFNALKNACIANNRTFGGTIEVFQQLTGWPIDQNNFSATTASIDRIEEQLNIADIYTNNLFAFDWTYIMPELNQGNKSFFNNYKSTHCIQNGIQVNTENIELTIFPNPGNGEISINKEITSIDIYNLSGEKIKTITSFSNLNKLNILQEGIYILIITTLEGDVVSIKYDLIFN